MTAPTAIQPHWAPSRSLRSSSKSTWPRYENTAVAASTSSALWAALPQVTPAQLDELRLFGADGLGGCRAQVVGLDVGRLHRPAQRPAEGRLLQVRQHRRGLVRCRARRPPPARARSGPTTTAVDARSWARSRVRCGRVGGHGGAGELAQLDVVPGHAPARRARAAGGRCWPPASAESARQARSSMPSETASAAARRAASPSRAARAARRRSTSRPAVTTSAVGTPALRASSVRNASCSTARGRPRATSGPASRYQSIRQNRVSSWLS